MSYFRWLQLQRRSGLPAVLVAAVSHPVSEYLKCLTFGSIRLQSYPVEVFQKAWQADVKWWGRWSRKEVGGADDYIVSYKSWWNECQPTCTVNSSWILVLRRALSIAAGDSNSHTICSMSVLWYLFVYKYTLRWTTADISCCIYINRTFFDGKDVWWCLSQEIAGILHESHANHQVIMYCQHDYSQWSNSQNADFALLKLIKPTNLDIKDAACLQAVHFLQHPTSRPTRRSTQDKMFNVPKLNILPLPARKYGKSTRHSTQRCHQVNTGESGLEAERVRALGALRSLRFRKKLVAEKWWTTHLLSNE